MKRLASFLSCALLAFVMIASVGGGASAQTQCALSFGMDQLSSSAVGELDFTMAYPSSSVELLGQGQGVRCMSLYDGATATFADDDSGTLSVSYESDTGIPTLAALGSCRLAAPSEPAGNVFPIEVARQLDTAGASLSPQVPIVVLGIDCDLTTTTLVTSTTTTTTISTVLCGDVTGNGSIQVTDALFILRSAVGAETCAPSICDTDASGTITVSDALRVLRISVGLAATLSCPVG